MPKFDPADYSFKAEFEAWELRTEFAPNALLLFFLDLYLNPESIQELAADALTDGPNDKKIDACFVDFSGGRAIIAQAYEARQWGTTAAPANKACDLNTAISWLLAGSDGNIPDRLRPKATELNDAIKNSEIERIELFYVHNCFESQNVQDELDTLAKSAKALLRSRGSESVSVVAREYGVDRIEELYRARDRDILVEDELVVDGDILGAESGEGWNAFVVSVKAPWLHELYQSHGNALFSANLRDFLGTTRHRGNINAAIQQTAVASPSRFWVYNNGITALSQSLERDGKLLRLKGISIINGAQTTGALGECRPEEIVGTRVLCRFVECDSNDIIEQIVRYNNTQNIIRPSDLRSNDNIQKRLASEFDQFGVSYVHRRSGRPPRNSISAELIAAAICAFHGDLQTAGRNRRDIFEKNTTYQKIFNQEITAEHVYLIWALTTSLDKHKNDLKRKISEDKATQNQYLQYEVLKYSMSKYFVLFVIGYCAEEIVGRRITSRFARKCKRAILTPDISEVQGYWSRVLECVIPFMARAIENEGSAYEVTRSSELSEKAAKSVRSTLDAFKRQTQQEFEGIRNATTV